MVKRQSEKQIIKGQSRGACDSCDRRRYFGLWSALTHPCPRYALLHLTDDYDPDDRFAETPDPGQVSKVDCIAQNAITKTPSLTKLTEGDDKS